MGLAIEVLLEICEICGSPFPGKGSGAGQKLRSAEERPEIFDSHSEPFAMARNPLALVQLHCRQA